MEPLLYHLEWDVALEVLFTIILLSFFLERALSVIFEHRLFVKWLDGRGIKEIVAVVASIGAIRYCEFDALAILMRLESNSWIGYAITGAIVAGGSKASIKLFHDLLNARGSYSRAVVQYMQEGRTRDEALELAKDRIPRTTKSPRISPPPTREVTVDVIPPESRENRA